MALELCDAALRAQRLVRVEVGGAGDCLFFSLAHQLWGDAGRFREVRADVVNHLSANARRYVPFLAVDLPPPAPGAPAEVRGAYHLYRAAVSAGKAPSYAFQYVYLKQMALDGESGTELELVAACATYHRPRFVVQWNGADLVPVGPAVDPHGRGAARPLRLFFIQAGHYQSLVDVDDGAADVGNDGVVPTTSRAKRARNEPTGATDGSGGPSGVGAPGALVDARPAPTSGPDQLHADGRGMSTRAAAAPPASRPEISCPRCKTMTDGGGLLAVSRGGDEWEERCNTCFLDPSAPPPVADTVPTAGLSRKIMQRRISSLVSWRISNPGVLGLLWGVGWGRAGEM
jgi:hypothetical protein